MVVKAKEGTVFEGFTALVLKGAIPVAWKPDFKWCCDIDLAHNRFMFMALEVSL